MSGCCGKPSSKLGVRLEGEQRALASAAAEATGTQLGATLDGLSRTAALIAWPTASDAEVEGGLRLLASQSTSVVAATLVESGRQRPMLLVQLVPRASLVDALPLAELATFGDQGLVALGPVQASERVGQWLPVAIQVGPRGPGAPMLLLGLSLQNLSARLASHAHSQASLEVVDGDSRAVAASGEGPPGSLDASRFAVLCAGVGFAVTEQGEQLATAVVPGKLGLSVVVAMPLATARAPIIALRRTVALGAVATSALLAMVTVLFVRRVTRRLEAVASTARAFSRGELGQRVAVDGADELGELASTFNAMGAELEASRAKLLTWNDELKARVDAATADDGWRRAA